MSSSLAELLLKAAPGVSVVVEFGDNAGKRVFQLGALTAELFNFSLSSLLSKNADSLTPLATNHIKAAEELAKRQRAEELRRELEEEEAEAEAAAAAAAATAAAAAAAAARKAAADARRDALRRELEGLGPPAEAQSVQGVRSCPVGFVGLVADTCAQQPQGRSRLTLRTPQRSLYSRLPSLKL